MIHSSYDGKLQSKILIDNAATLYSQLRLLNKTFFYCIEYHEFITMKGLNAVLGDFLHPSLSDSTLLAEMWTMVQDRQSIKRNSSKSSVLKLEKLKYSIARLEAVMLQLRDVCGKSTAAASQ
jgi:hypothetical protein